MGGKPYFPCKDMKFELYLSLNLAFSGANLGQIYMERDFHFFVYCGGTFMGLPAPTILCVGGSMLLAFHFLFTVGMGRS